MQELTQQQIDEHYMGRALELAYQAVDADEVPVGAIVVHRQQIIGAASNQRQTLGDPTAHAEMIAITQASAALGDWRLENTCLYVTLEPCPMCAGAILQSRIPRLVFGATDPKAGAVASLYELLSDARLNHRSEVVSGVLSQRCGAVLTDFFASKRALGKK